MLSPLISLSDLNIHMSKTPFCHLKNGGPASWTYFVSFFAIKFSQKVLRTLLTCLRCMIRHLPACGAILLISRFFFGGCWFALDLHTFKFRFWFDNQHSLAVTDCISIWFVLQTLLVMKQIESCCLTTGFHFGRSCPQKPDRERATMVSFKQQTGPRPSRERGRVWGREVLNQCAIQRPSINHVNRFGGGTESTPARLM